MNQLTCFKAYDIRGRLGEELNEEIAYRIGRAYGDCLKPERVVLGADVRPTSEDLKAALARGLMDAGVDVVDIGMTGTEEVYFASFHLEVDGGIEVTASHNPIDYNGMKLVGKDARPISNDTGLLDIKRSAERAEFDEPVKKGTLEKVSILEEYIDHLLGYIDPQVLVPMKLVVNSGNGASGHVIDAIEERFRVLGVPVEFIKVQHQPDGSFPNGIPNPLLTDRRQATVDAVIEHDADMGVAWDGDFDRCFLFDESGTFIEGYYIVGLLAESFLSEMPGAKIIHDPRLSWNTIDIVTMAGGTPVMSKTGHAFIKQIMREQDAVYGGEMSAHHYFRDFAYCDSGMIPWLLVIELMSRKEQKLSTLVNDRIALFPSSGEINRTVVDPGGTIAQVREAYEADAIRIDETDGISLEFNDWRFNLRSSNTEPVIRLNVESRGNKALMERKTAEILALMDV